MSAIVRLGPAYIGMAIDASDSMDKVAKDVVAGVNAQAKTLIATATDRTFLTALSFADTVKPLFSGEVPRFRGITSETYRAEGNTALLDAWAALLDDLEPKVEDPRHGVSPATGLLIAYTDGDENCSVIERDSPKHQNLLRRVHRLTATGRWTFCLVGPEQSLDAACRMLGVPRGNARGFVVGDRRWAADSFAASSASLTGYMDARARGIGASEEFFGPAGALPPRGR